MNLKEWQALSPEEQEKRWDELSEEDQRSVPANQEFITQAQRREWWRLFKEGALPGGRQGKCPAGLIELRNALRREIPGEKDSSKSYREASGKLTHFAFAAGANSLRQMSEEEYIHSFVLEAVVEQITERCGE